MNSDQEKSKFVDCLRQSELFKGFDDSQLSSAAEILNPNRKTYGEAEQVFERGNVATCCWLIMSGKLMVGRNTLRDPFLHNLYHIGFVTGVQGLVNPGSIRPVTMIAEEETELLEISSDDIEKFEEAAQLILWKNVSKILLRKLFYCTEREEH